jgi:hypothetical protein
MEGEQCPQEDRICEAPYSQGLEMDGKVAVPEGTSWFMIENKSDTPVEFHLKCYSTSE